MGQPFLCPVCHDNRTEFMQIYKLAREITKDPDTGAVTYASDEWETVAKDGRPELDVQCRLCGHVGKERDFERAARRDDTRLPRPGLRRA